jgi:hypothetical protein
MKSATACFKLAQFHPICKSRRDCLIQHVNRPLKWKIRFQWFEFCTQQEMQDFHAQIMPRFRYSKFDECFNDRNINKLQIYGIFAYPGIMNYFIILDAAIAGKCRLTVHVKKLTF